jgi:hypothetical protein
MTHENEHTIDRRRTSGLAALCLLAASATGACNVPAEPDPTEGRKEYAKKGCDPSDLDCQVTAQTNAVNKAADAARVEVSAANTSVSPGYFAFFYFDHKVGRTFAIEKYWTANGDTIIVNRFICDGPLAEPSNCEKYVSNQTDAADNFTGWSDRRIPADRLGVSATDELARDLNGAALRAYRDPVVDGLRLAAAWTDRDVGRACAQHCSDEEVSITGFITDLACAVFGEGGSVACHTARGLGKQGGFMRCYSECLDCYDEQNEVCATQGSDQSISDGCRVRQPWACDEHGGVHFRGILRSQ